MELIQSLLLFGIFIAILKRFWTSKKIKTGYLKIPQVSGSLPFFGHALSIFVTHGPRNFFAKCFAEVGPTFGFKLFNRKYAYICGKDEIEEFFKCSEADLSLYHLVRELCFMNSFFSKELLLSKTFGVFKQGVNTNPQVFLEQMDKDAKCLVTLLKTKHEITARDLRQYIMSSITTSFLGFELSEQMFEELDKIMEHFNLIISFSSFIPRPILKLYAVWKVHPLAKNFMDELNTQVEGYRSDGVKNDSKLLRICADYKNEEIGRVLNPREISGLALLVLFSATANTSIGLFNVLADIASKPEYIPKLIKESQTQDELKDLVAAPLLSGCVNETLRLTTGYWAITRIPREGKRNLGKWDLDGVQGLAICAPLLHTTASNAYSQPQKYWPERYELNGEPKAPPSLLSWGSGVHMCPARIYAGYSMKIGLIQLLRNFELQIGNSALVSGELELDYFAASSFSKRKCDLYIKQKIIIKT